MSNRKPYITPQVQQLGTWKSMSPEDVARYGEAIERLERDAEVKRRRDAYMDGIARGTIQNGVGERRAT